MLLIVSLAAVLVGGLLSDPQMLHVAMLRLSGLAIVATGIVLFAVPRLLQRSVFRPLAAVFAGVRRVNAGDFTSPVAVTFNDEIGLLANSFNRMVAEVHSTVSELEARVAARTHELAQSEARYRDLVEQIDEVIFRIALPDGRVEYVSPSVERMLGYPQARILATVPFLAMAMSPDEAVRAAERIAAMARQSVLPQDTYCLHDAWGRERWIEQSNTAIYVEGQIVAIEGVCRDVTEIREQQACLLNQQRPGGPEEHSSLHPGSAAPRSRKLRRRMGPCPPPHSPDLYAALRDRGAAQLSTEPVGGAVRPGGGPGSAADRDRGTQQYPEACACEQCPSCGAARPRSDNGDRARRWGRLYPWGAQPPSARAAPLRSTLPSVVARSILVRREPRALLGVGFSYDVRVMTISATIVVTNTDRGKEWIHEPHESIIGMEARRVNPSAAPEHVASGSAGIMELWDRLHAVVWSSHRRDIFSLAVGTEAGCR
ncbi:MAG: PAS domain S-box protein [Chloroflexia bacterium]|nr:PAS domain S-box protein [Chloroflexia bacterium]